jgi:hypothetical protein
LTGNEKGGICGKQVPLFLRLLIAERRATRSNSSCWADLAPPPHIAAADLQFALPEIAAAFTGSGSALLKYSFGYSGNFARHIMPHAPFERFPGRTARVAPRTARIPLTGV